MGALRFDFARGRLDTSLHPFCGGATGDVRITTRYDEGDFTRSLMGVLHETGHALYEQGRPARWLAQPVGDARGMVMHESQSLLVEMQACRTREFLGFLAPLAQSAFGRHDPALAADNLHKLYTRVEPGFIRVDADEVTYPAHILLRYQLETAMIAGDLAVADLPQAFNEGMRALLGLDVVPNARLVWTNEESDQGAVTTVTFEERDGKTLLTMSELYPSKEALDQAIEGMDGAMPETFEQLDEFLAG